MEQTGGLLWTRGGMTFRVQGVGREPDRIVAINRPFALLGQTSDVDITINDPAVSARHVYLHLDLRGVYAVDLITRTGTRLNGTDLSVGWLRLGDWLEVAGRRVELIEIWIDGVLHDPSPCDADLLVEMSRTSLIAVALDPQRPASSPWVLGSELVFLGSSAACGIPIKEPTVARTHCALLRTETAAYVIDLCGQHTWIDKQPARGASIIRNGQILTLGSARFLTRVEPATESKPAEAGPATLLAQLIEPVVSNPPCSSASLELIPLESQRDVLAWMLGALQGNQGESLRQHADSHLAMARLLHKIEQDHTTVLDAHLARIENLDHTLASLRAELEVRSAPAAVNAFDSHPISLPPPQVTPLRISHTIPQNNNSQASATWLLQRVSQLENQKSSLWRAFLDRLGLIPRRAT